MTEEIPVSNEGREPNGFNEAIEAAQDTERVNSRLSEIGREDLGIKSPAKLAEAPRPYDELFMNNFVELFKNTKKLFDDPDMKGKVDQVAGVGRNTPEVAARLNVNPENRFVLLSSHIPKEAFARMYILFPELTEKVVDVLGGEPSEDRNNTSFKAYELMGRLVDEDDYLVRDGMGSIDEAYLTR